MNLDQDTIACLLVEEYQIYEQGKKIKIESIEGKVGPIKTGCLFAYWNPKFLFLWRSSKQTPSLARVSSAIRSCISVLSKSMCPCSSLRNACNLGVLESTHLSLVHASAISTSASVCSCIRSVSRAALSLASLSSAGWVARQWGQVCPPNRWKWFV